MPSLHMPKSASLQWPSLSRRTLSNFRSLSGNTERNGKNQIFILGALLSSRDEWKIRKGFKLISKQLLKWQVCFRSTVTPCWCCFCLYLTEVEISGETKYKRSSEDSFSGVPTDNSLRPLNGSQEMSDVFRWPLQLPRQRKCFDVNIHSAYWRGKTRVIVFVLLFFCGTFSYSIVNQISLMFWR